MMLRWLLWLVFVGAGLMTRGLGVQYFSTTERVLERAVSPTNLYHTVARARAALSASGAIAYDSGTGVISLTQASIDHGSIGGLSDDDHTHYHTDARALTWIGGRSTSDLPEGSNLYHTSERVDDRVASLLQNGTGIGWTYDDGGGTLTPAVTLAPFDTDDLAEGSNLYYTNARADARIALQAGAANGLATLGADSKIPTSQLPALAITDTFVVANEAAMLALTAETGDVAIRTDENKSYILAGSDPSDVDDWEELLTPTDAVLSVNGQTGAVTLTTTHISEGTNLYHTDERVDDRVATLLQNGTGIGWTYNDGAGTLTPAVTLAPFDTDDLAEGANLYYTDERAQDAVGGSLIDSASIDFTYDDGDGEITAAVLPAGVDHNSLANLATGDVHTMYALLAGRSGGQTLIGGTASGNDLTLQSTAHATRGKLLFGTSAYDEVNNRLGLGTTSPAVLADIRGDVRVGLAAGAGVQSDATLFSSTGDYTTGTITCTNNSNAFSGAGTAWTADMVGHELVASGASTGLIVRIATLNVGAQTGTFDRTWRGTTGSGKSYTIYGGKVDWDSGPSPLLTFTRAQLAVPTRMRVGSTSVLGGSSGTAVLAVAEDMVPLGSVSWEAALDFAVNARAGGGFGYFAACRGKLMTQAAESILAIGMATFLAELDLNINSTLGGASIVSNFYSSGDVGAGTTVGVAELAHYWADAYTSSAGTIGTCYGLRLKQQTVGGTANYQLYSDGGANFLGNDNSKTYWGTARDAAIYYDGTDLVLSPREVGTGAVCIGTGAAGVDYQLKVNGETNDGLLTWMEDEDYWQPEDDVHFAEAVSFAANSPSEITGDQNDYNFGATSFVRLSTDASRNVTGLANGRNGRVLYLANVGSQNIVIQHENAGSSAANRVICLSGADTTLAAGATMILIYDATSSRWREMA